jgi:hypothetical protein
MQLTADQELRRELLLVSLSKRPDLEGAMDLAAQMEQFVLKGSWTSSAAVTSAPSAAANGAGRSGDPSEMIPLMYQTKPLVREASSQSTAVTPANGSASGSKRTSEPAAVPGGSKKRRWSNGDDERLRRLWRSDHSLEEIAEAMGRTTPSLYSRARALGMSKRSPMVDKREATRPNGNGREAACAGAAPAPATEDDIFGKARQHAQAIASKARPTGFEIRRYSAVPPRGQDSSKLGSAVGGAKPSRPSCSAAELSFQTAPLEAGVEPIIHFLRSRDYSVVRVEDGRFRLDNRQILDADELREKANKVRQSLGKPPFAPHSYGPAG